MEALGTRIWQSIWYAFHAQCYLAADRPQEAVATIDAALLQPGSEIIVGMPLFDGATPLDFAGATQVFSFAQGFRPIWLAADLTPVATSEGVTVNAGYTFDEHPPIDLLFVPGGSGAGVAAAMQDEAFQCFVKNAAVSAQ